MDAHSEKLPLWRLICGIAVLASLLAVALAVLPVYVADYRFNRYVRNLATQPEIARMPDDKLREDISAEARRLSLPVQPTDVAVLHNGARVQLHVALIKAHVWHADLHFSAIQTR